MNGGFRVRLRLSGLGVEKLLNQGWNKGIRLKRVKRGRNRSVTVECTPEAAASLTALAREKGYRAEEYRPVGLLKWARLLGRRWGLLLGTAVCVALMVYALGFVWQVRIENAGAYEGEVRACLEEWGIVPGIRRSQVHPSALRDQLEWRFPRVQWVQVEWAGVALRVRLEEGVPPPQVETAGKNGDVVAAEDGCALAVSRLRRHAGSPGGGFRPGRPGADPGGRKGSGRHGSACEGPGRGNGPGVGQRQLPAAAHRICLSLHGADSRTEGDRDAFFFVEPHGGPRQSHLGPEEDRIHGGRRLAAGKRDTG